MRARRWCCWSSRDRSPQRPRSLHDPHPHGLRREERLQLRDLRPQRGQLFFEVDPAEPGEAAGRLRLSTGEWAVLAICAIAVVVLGILIAVNMLSVRRSKRWDLTANQQYSLSEQSIKLLQGLDAPVKFLVFDQADGFDRFREAGLVDRATGDLFREEVLARGATRPAADSFRAFRGRDPDPVAMLVRHGLQ